ncbi:sigma-70 family RNA polymerase sigma factor [uncultured Agathobaculum sp.]|uniref:sigma-70 family RNA polymerase sigma factor n=1 Tax=uncultured Agathobaculum sp. TaxID=2048140 RepID=UPI00320789B3
MFMPMIIGEIRRYLRDNSALRVSRSLRDTAYKALQAKEAFVRKHQREPDIVELAKLMDMPKEEVVLALDAILDPVSLFEPVFHDGTDTVCVMDQVGDNKNTDDQWLASIALREAIDSLNEREKRIIRLRFFEGRTQMEVADEIHISQAQVSRLEKGALEHIRKRI